MPASCIISDCNLKYTHSEDVSFHKFPLKNPDLLKQWMQFAGRDEGWRPTKWSAICSRHFVTSDFKDCPFRKILLPSAVPTVRTVPADLSALPVISYETVWSEDGPHLPRHAEDYLPEEEVAFTQNATLVTVSDGGEDIGSLEGEDDVPLIQITCRICGVVFSRVADSLLADLVQSEDMVRKYLPFVNLELPNLPRKICLNCSKVVTGFSKFSESVLRAQSDLEHRFAPQPARTNAVPINPVPVARTKQESAIGKPLHIKQEPIATINIKEEKIEYARQKDLLPVEEPIEGPLIMKNQTFGGDPHRIYLFNNINQDLANRSAASNTLTTQQHTREPSKNCEILEIVNLYPPIVDITSATVTEVQPYEITLPTVTTETELFTSFPSTSSYSAQLKVENTAELDTEQDEYYLPAEKLSFINTLEEHSYTKLPIQADDNKDEIFPDMVSDSEGRQLCNSANVIAMAKKKPVLGTNIRRWSCTYCDRRFTRHRRMLYHRAWECPGRRKHSVCCQFCRRKFCSWSRARAHVCICPKRAWKHCRLKWKMSLEKVKLRHASQDDGDGGSSDEQEDQAFNTKFPCSLCERSYSNSSNLRRHLSTHRPRHQWNHKCGVCSKVFDKLVDLKRHLQIAPCGNGGNRIALEASETLIAELPILHNVPEGPLTGHVTAPSNGAPNVDRLLYVCPTCNKIFQSYNSLKMHEPIHTGTKTYICETCGKRFSGPSNLWQHRLTHSEVRQFNCSLCPKVFKRKGGLSQHVRAIHMNLKPHHCPTCGHGYALKADMTRCRHSRQHEATIPAC